MTLDKVNLALFSMEIIKEPTTYEESINSEKKKTKFNGKIRLTRNSKKWRKEVLGK
jgi:hypothetical protein